MVGIEPTALWSWPGIFFKLARCGYTLRVTSQASYSPEYITPTYKFIMVSSFTLALAIGIEVSDIQHINRLIDSWTKLKW
jgi:hypothetical protein